MQQIVTVSSSWFNVEKQKLELDVTDECSVLSRHLVDMAPYTLYRGNIGNIRSHQSVTSTVGLSNS